MASQGESKWSRREFLRDPTLAGAAVILGLKSDSAAAELAEGLLKAEGFTDVQ
jgi:hypothetical protein